MLYNNNDKKLVGTTWLAGNSSCTLVIPKSLAREYGIDHPSNVVIQGRPEGILITKLELENRNDKYASMENLVSVGDVENE
jgi:bifunctional DNA-binding transcriptional regulator/antitoxin component of YhaV-PrlF toxin-antitoxin module